MWTVSTKDRLKIRERGKDQAAKTGGALSAYSRPISCLSFNMTEKVDPSQPGFTFFLSQSWFFTIQKIMLPWLCFNLASSTQSDCSFPNWAELAFSWARTKDRGCISRQWGRESREADPSESAPCVMSEDTTSASSWQVNVTTHLCRQLL